MPLSDSQKLDFLWKKIMFGYATTDSRGKHATNEFLTSPLPMYAHQIYAQAGDVPAVPPAVTSEVVEVRVAVRCRADPTVPNEATWIAVANVAGNPFDDTNRLGDWIPPAFGPGYELRVYAGDPDAAGQLLPATEGQQEWMFDYVAGVLHFPNDVPAGLAAEDIYVSGYRYVGIKGMQATGTVEGTARGYSLRLVYDETELAQVEVPVGWSVNITDAPNCTFSVTHDVGSYPISMNFFGQGPTGTAYRLRLSTTYTELFYDTATPNQFTIGNATPFATGAQSNSDTMCHILFLA